MASVLIIIARSIPTPEYIFRKPLKQVGTENKDLRGAKKKQMLSSFNQKVKQQIGKTTLPLCAFAPINVSSYNKIMQMSIFFPLSYLS